MILNNTPTNTAVLSNVSQVSSFAIKATAKSFQILSSGLYANKIKAIIRELSCNAYDSHVAANKSDIPFDIHLPNKIDPNFSIRDYGVGLTHDEVINVYTTYFESTKTSSNEFVGALGLGSKSPFSYTDNFTVTTIKDGIKGIYSAFINDSGVPSIALMFEAMTDELTGVEIKFSVNTSEDMMKFISEAVNVLVWFKIKPNVTGSSAYNGYHDQLKYWSARPIELDIIPGIHRADKHQQFSNAVMGNIAYPIDVPNIEQNLGDLGNLLRQRLIINFDIGELDFQASREGLAYSPKTIEAIKSKLQYLQDKMYSLFVERASKIDQNKWIFSRWIIQSSSDDLWKQSLIEYVKQNPSELYYVSHNNYLYETKNEFPITTEKLQELNIKLTILNRVSKTRVRKISFKKEAWNFIRNNCAFFLNDTNKGVIGRVTESIMSQSPFLYGNNFIIEKIDKTKDYQIDSFFDLIYNPPQNTIFKVSSLSDSSGTTKRKSDVRILRLVGDTLGRGFASAPFHNLIWKEESSLDNIDDSTKNFYYIPLSGFTPITTKIISLDFKETILRLKMSKLDPNIVVYGVRKTDLEKVLTMSNWINVEDYIYSLIQNNKSDLLRSTVNSVYTSNFNTYINNDIVTMLSDDSPFKKMLVKLKTDRGLLQHGVLDLILNDFDPKFSVELSNYRKTLTEEIHSVNNRYPLLSIISDYRIAGSEKAIADYINLIDEKNQERKTLCIHI